MKIADTVCVTETYSTLKVTPQLFQVNYTRLTWTLSKDWKKKKTNTTAGQTP